MQDDSALDRAVAMVKDLRNRCDWDRVQTRETLRPYLVEEIHELDAALASNDREAIRDEVADLMLHLAWQLVLGAELGEFSPDEIADRLVAKMRRRHPHLFALGPKEEWHNLKARERRSGIGTLAGLPTALPALLLAFRLQERAAAMGFDWPDTSGPADKVREELAEVEIELGRPGATEMQPPNDLADELGDLLFAVVNLARKAGVHPDLALDRANRKFRDRFEQLEALAGQRGIGLESAGLQRLDELWEEVKRRSC
ncbi:MAG TPA: nucleoside triphosphate pyrophosphohydrolase [Gemmatimonadales bacterium]|jgi:MazG family protein